MRLSVCLLLPMKAVKNSNVFTWVVCTKVFICYFFTHNRGYLVWSLSLFAPANESCPEMKCKLGFFNFCQKRISTQSAIYPSFHYQVLSTTFSASDGTHFFNEIEKL